jgi:hypothetical protein
MMALYAKLRDVADCRFAYLVYKRGDEDRVDSRYRVDRSSTSLQTYMPKLLKLPT